MFTVFSPGIAGAQGEPASRSCFLDGWSDSLRCYRMPVGESELAVMVAPAVNASGLEPVYLLAGGPGQAASGLTSLLNAFRKINRTRDIVMVDRRGAGHSGAFHCGFEREMPSDLQAFTGQLADCYLKRADFAETLNSRQTVEDLELVRRALGYRRIALWGGSWGTRTALLYQQWYPRSLSALILDGVAPIETKVFLTASASERALRLLEEDCSRDPVCAGFGDWRGDLDRLLREWNEERAANFPDPFTGAPVEEPLTRWVLTTGIRTALYNSATAAQIPYAAHRAGRGDYLPLSGLIGHFVNMDNPMATGLTFSVACAEELNRISPAEVDADSAGTFVGSAFFDLYRSGCEVWPVEAKPYATPEPREHPVLLISGQADPITPPYYAEEQLDYLAQKQHLVVPGGAHINSYHGCIPGLIARFLEAPAEPLESRCVADIKRPPFMAAAYGPALGASGETDQRGE